MVHFRELPLPKFNENWSIGEQNAKWFDDVIPLRTPSNNDAYHAMIEQAYADKDDLFLEEEDGNLSNILDAKCERMDNENVLDKPRELSHDYSMKCSSEYLITW